MIHHSESGGVVVVEGRVVGGEVRLEVKIIVFKVKNVEKEGEKRDGQELRLYSLYTLFFNSVGMINKILQSQEIKPFVGMNVNI